MDTLAREILEAVWDHLIAGAYRGRERSPYTLMQVATIGVEGCPKLRTVILRRADKDRKLVSFHSDARSEKVAEIEQDNHVALLAGDWNAGIQIRLEGTAHPVAEQSDRLAVWKSSRPGTLTLYRSPVPPGTPLDNPTDARPPASRLSAHADMDGFEHFCLIDVSIRHIDYLDVSGTFHRRVQFSREHDEWCGHWVAP